MGRSITTIVCTLSVLGTAFACGSTPSQSGSQGTGLSGISGTSVATDANSSPNSGTDSGTDSGTASSAGNTDPAGSAGSIKFDVAAPDGGIACGDVGGGSETFSYIWIANSSQGTVSKINTQTLVEEGRYIVRPDSNGNPSRTSVSLSGDVAVGNRSGGVVKIFSNLADCVESNGMPGIQTSTGAADILPWGTEECVAWYTEFDYTTQRPLAWAQGTWNASTCAYENEKLWTAGGYNNGTGFVVLMDGETGIKEGEATVNNVIGWAGLYGGAVDGDGHFWTVDHNWSGPSTLVRVDRGDLSVQTWPVTGQVHYGLTVDAQGRPWLCGGGGASRFEPIAQTWTHLAPTGGTSELGGCMTDGNGTLWHSVYNQGLLVGIDTETVQIVQSLPIPSYVHGVSIDFDGYVWGVQFSGSQAYRVDPQTGAVDTVSGLIGAYTYSDMTGFALSSAGTPSG